MTSHRNRDIDLDRMLDIWLDDGPVVLPDRAFNAVLETVDRTRQRRAGRAAWRYFSMITSTTRRLGLPVAVVGALAILIVTASIVAVLQTNIGGPRLGSAPETTLTVENVRDAVLGEAEAPAGTALERSGVVNLGFLIPDPAVRDEWAALGLATSDTWHSYFSGAGGEWVTAGMVWPDAATAQEGLASHESVLLTVLQGEQDLAVTGLGDEGSCYSFVDNAIMNGQGAACLFRIGNATFFVPGSGTGVEASDVVAVSRSVAERAR